jgi:hypothetical protein
VIFEKKIARLSFFPAEPGFLSLLFSFRLPGL